MTDPPPQPSARHNEHGQPIGPPVLGWAGARTPGPVTLTGAWCTVVPLRAEHAADLYAAWAPLGAPLWTYLPWEAPETVAETAGLIDAVLTIPGFVSFAILDRAGVARGMCSYLRIEPGAGSLEIGAIVLGTGLRRTFGATEAMWLLARHAFEDLGFRRYEWKCDALNEPSRGAALRLGFRFEGVFRQALVVKGRNRDTAWFSIIDAEWPALSTAMQRWLAPDNADELGRQRTPLVVPAAGPVTHPG